VKDVVTIKRASFVCFFAVLAQAAVAADASGPSALALAAVTAAYDTGLPANDRLVVESLFDGKDNIAYPKGKKITVKAKAIICHASNVDIANFSCELSFKAGIVNLTGRRAHELFATLSDAGVEADVGAGQIFEAVKTLVCTLEPSEIEDKGGGGATCTFTAGQ
jgi:hypothetical protein